MGLPPSKIEDDKVLVLCQKRKRFVREALDGRCALAASHHAYILSLRETASLLRKCFEPEVLKDAGRNSLTAPAKVTAQSSFPDAREVSQVFENADGLRSLHEEGIPEHNKGEADFAEPEDDFDNPSTETRARVFKNRNDVLKNIDSQSTNAFRDNSKNKRTVIGRSSPDVLPMGGRLKKPSIDVGNVPTSFLATLFACCREDVTVPESPSQAEIKYLTWHRSVSSQLPPSRNSLGNNAGSHISTLDWLYAWESKLYDEVKASSAICRRYDARCKKLRYDIAFTRASVKDLHSRVLVAVHKIGFISKNIEDVRDKYLQTQLDELIGGIQKLRPEISFQSESQRQARFLLSVELRKLNSELDGIPQGERKVSRNRNAVDVSLTETAVAPIFTTCEMWIKLLDGLPTTDLEEAIEGLIADISRSIPLIEKYIDLQENVRAAKERIWRRKD
ncbi:hypothetical protein BDA96_02G445300 [Sorghum bicolor]|uniref:DUF630 domain-containing protein n=2 Tax=Sorghum bicolor TaxID=4558 RepID=A0A921UVJ0_SORBI|nr:hypothetical protein BDA96_02G445300 [Sorghum bicolor]OQU90529.1 hypothetical protein SORBI_3002G425101 [Sorghum bicolor]